MPDKQFSIIPLTHSVSHDTQSTALALLVSVWHPPQGGALCTGQRLKEPLPTGELLDGSAEVFGVRKMSTE